MIIHFLNPNQCAVYSSKRFKIHKLIVFCLSFSKNRKKKILCNGNLETANESYEIVQKVCVGVCVYV